MTTAKQIAITPVATQSVIFNTGLNESVSSIEMQAGDLLSCLNYYITEGTSGGYVSLGGYERFDGTALASTVALGANDDDTAREAARLLIQDVGTIGTPCQGPVRGVYIFKGIVYAFRDKVGGLAAAMFKATGAGWVEINTAANPLVPGGRYSFITYNFFATSAGERMYWANGVDKARSFDGTTVRIMDNAGMNPNDKPTFIAAHLERLWLTYPGGSLQYSVAGMDFDNDGIDGEANDWLGVNGAGEIGIGGDITALRSSVGGTLIVFGRDFIKVLEGGPLIDDTTLKTFSDALGAYPYTVDKLFDTLVFMSDMGVTTLAAAQEFGDFSANTISEKVKTTLFKYKHLISCAVTIKKLNQYRLYFSDGRGIIFSYYNKKLKGATTTQYANPVTDIVEGFDSLNNLEVFFISTSGRVYNADSGTSFDGTPIPHLFSTAYFHYATPRNWKRFYRITFEVDSISPITFSIKPAFDYSGTGVPSSAIRDFFVEGDGDLWDVGLWDVMHWSGGAITNRVFYDLLGLGSNMNITVSYTSKFSQQHTFQNMIIDYSNLGRQM